MDTEALARLAFNFGVPTAILFWILWRADKHFGKFLNHFSTMTHELTLIRVLIDTIASKLGVRK